MNYKIFPIILREGKLTTSAAHCTLSNGERGNGREERGIVLGPLQNKFKEKMLD